MFQNQRVFDSLSLLQRPCEPLVRVAIRGLTNHPEWGDEAGIRRLKHHCTRLKTF